MLLVQSPSSRENNNINMYSPRNNGINLYSPRNNNETLYSPRQIPVQSQAPNNILFKQ
jgi:hypothetical protein